MKALDRHGIRASVAVNAAVATATRRWSRKCTARG